MSEQVEIPTKNDDAYHNFFDQYDHHYVEEELDTTANFNLLCLDTTTATHHHYHTPPPPPCATCGCPVCNSSVLAPPPTAAAAASNISSLSNNKRRSPEIPTTTNPPAAAVAAAVDQLDQPSKKPKKLFAEEGAAVPNLSGFSKIPMPAGGPHVSMQTPQSLRRCVSDPYRPPVVNNDPQSPPESSKIAAAMTTPASKGSASLPPRPPAAELRRTVSDPSPSKRLSLSASSNDESPNFETFKRIKSCIKEMKHWMDEILPDQGMLPEEEEETKATEGNAMKGNSVDDGEESVSIERTGDCLTIHLSCPCGKAYQILVVAGSCYYKLI